MLDLSKPIQLCRSHRKDGNPRQFFVCEWQSTVIASIPGGVFLVEAGHFLDAKQTAKKTLRDELVGPLRFAFIIRPASLDELTQIKNAPEGTILEMKKPAPATEAGGQNFAGDSLADSTSKT